MSSTVRATGTVVRVDPQRVPDGRQVRRLTAQIQDARAGRGLGALVSEVWYTIITVGLCLAFVAGVTSTVQDAAALVDGTVVGSGGAMLTGELPGALAALAMAGAMLSLAGRLGPVGVGAGGASWWLPMPVDRRGLLRWTVLVWPAVAAGVGLVLTPTLVAVLAGGTTVGAVLGWAGVGCAVFALMVALAALAQTRERPAPWTVTVDGGRASRGRGARRAGARRQGARVPDAATVGELLMLVAAAAVALLAVTGASGTSAWTESGEGTAAFGWRSGALDDWHLAGGWWWWAVPLLVGAVVTTLTAERRAGRIDGAGLRMRGALGERAKVAVMSLDLRELGRVLGSAGHRARRRSLRWAGAVRWFAGGPRRVVVLTDLLLLARTPRLIGQVTVAALLGVVVGRVEMLRAGLPLYASLVVLGFWAANAAVAGGRHAEMAPVLDRLLPVSARAVRLTRGVIPLLGAVLWSVVVLGALAARSGLVQWLLLAPAWALVLATAAVRSAYRPAPLPKRAAVVSPMGGVPNTGGMFKGLDVALVGTLPTALILQIDTMATALVTAQWVVSLVVVGIMGAVAGRRRRALAGA